MTTRTLAEPRGAVARDAGPSRISSVPAFDADQFDELSEMIGEEGVMEMVTIFDAETRQRLRRVAAGGLDNGTLVREMHTLKGAAGTVAAPCLTALGRSLEFAAHQGIPPTRDDMDAIEAALEAWLEAVRVWSADH